VQRTLPQTNEAHPRQPPALLQDGALFTQIADACDMHLKREKKIRWIHREAGAVESDKRNKKLGRNQMTALIGQKKDSEVEVE
jgi:hypothetical protein